MTGNNKEQKLYNAKQYKLYVASKPKNLTPPRTHGNDAQTENYTSPVWNVRAGADDHFSIRSRGFV